MGDSDEQIGETRDGSPCELCRQRDGYCQHHGPDQEAGAGGRPAHQPTERDRRMVRHLVASGWTVPDIAEALGIARPTLRKYYEEELEYGLGKAVAKVAQSFFKSATSGDHPRAALRWLERRDPDHWAEVDDRATDEDRDPQVDEDEEGREVWEIAMPDEGVAK